MIKNKTIRKLEDIAPGSRLIRQIDRLLNLSCVQNIKEYQEIINKLNLEYSLLDYEGRLELINDLIAGRKDRLADSEKRALNYLLSNLPEQTCEKWSFPGFYMDCLARTIEQHAGSYSGTPFKNFSFHNGKGETVSAAKNIFLALCLTGFISTSCAQKKDAAPPVPSETKEKSKITAQILTSNKTNQAERKSKEILTAGGSGYVLEYTVEKGDSITTIADRLGIDYRALAGKNNIEYNKKKDWFVLYPGQVLILSNKGRAVMSADNIASPNQADNAAAPGRLLLTNNKTDDGCEYRLIKKGDSLWTISKRNHIPIKTIVEVNNLTNPDKIRFGDMIKIPVAPEKKQTVSFSLMEHEDKVGFLKKRTVGEGHPYLSAIVELAEEYSIDPRLYASLIWEESWFDSNARSKDNCRKLAQLDPRFHAISNNEKDNFRKSLGYLRYEFVYYRKKGFSTKSAAICALAAYNGGNTRIRNYIKEGRWDGKNIDTIPLKETRDYVRKIICRCETNYHARL